MDYKEIAKILSDVLIEHDPPCICCEWDCPDLKYDSHNNCGEACGVLSTDCWIRWADWNLMY